MNTIVAQPATEPITLTSAKLSLRITHDEEDDRIRQLIVAARTYFEEETGWALINRSIVGTAAFWPKVRQMQLPWAPLYSVASVVYEIEAGQQTFAAANYYVDTFSRPGKILLAPTVAWPTAALYPPGITVTYVSGFGVSTTSVPDDARNAIMQLVSAWYENPEAIYVPDSRRAGAPNIVPMSAQQTIDRYRRRLLGS